MKEIKKIEYNILKDFNNDLLKLSKELNENDLNDINLINDWDFRFLNTIELLCFLFNTYVIDENIKEYFDESIKYAKEDLLSKNHLNCLHDDEQFKEIKKYKK